MTKPRKVLDQETIARRNMHAIEELRYRGFLRNGKLPPGLRLLMKLFPRQKAPYYGDYWLYGLQQGILFGLPFIAVLAWGFAAGGEHSVWLGVGVGLLAGAEFGGGMSYYMNWANKKAKLTPWEQLDEPAPKEVPKGAVDPEELTAQALRLTNRFNRLR